MLLCLLLILLINSNKRINEHKNVSNILKSIGTCDSLSLKILNVSQSVEKTMIQTQLLDYNLSSISLPAKAQKTCVLSATH